MRDETPRVRPEKEILGKGIIIYSDKMMRGVICGCARLGAGSVPLILVA